MDGTKDISKCKHIRTRILDDSKAGYCTCLDCFFELHISEAYNILLEAMQDSLRLEDAWKELAIGWRKLAMEWKRMFDEVVAEPKDKGGMPPIEVKRDGDTVIFSVRSKLGEKA